MQLFFRALQISSKRSNRDPILAMLIEQEKWEVVPGVVRERSLKVRTKVRVVRCMGDPCRDHPPRAPVTLITPVVMCSANPKSRSEKE